MIPVLLLCLLLGAKPAEKRKPAAEFSLKDAGGKSVQLSDYRGKVVLLNFWATWCIPCKAEIPWFMGLARAHQELAVIGVSLDEGGWEAVKPFVAKLGITYPILLGNDAVANLYGGVDALPSTFLIDREGRIAAVYVGLVQRKSLERDLEKLL